MGSETVKKQEYLLERFEIHGSGELDTRSEEAKTINTVRRCTTWCS